jgi:hypothetical protein
MRKYSKNFKLTPSKHDLILKHIEKLEEGQFEAETKNYIYFYEVWLKGILGYDLDENVLVDEKEEQGRGKSEFILKSGDKKFMVVELKDQKSDLDKNQNRVNDKRTPVDQAFDYAQHTGDIDWILVSNYNEFRLYNWHKKGHYISFNASELLDKTIFSYFMLSFSKESYIKADYIDKLMDNTVVIERKLEKEFYKLYNETRLMLIKEFEEFNKLSRLDAIHYAQVIMNRYMFICFAEDIDLLPAQVSTDTILTPILKGNLRHRSIWQRLNELFLDINDGNEYKKISSYNGGIFAENIDHLKIRDIVEDQNFFNDVYQDWKFQEYEKDVNNNIGPYGEKVNPIYRNMLTISTFDFSTELDVNILGHIFENSIGDIEELKEDSKGRRKKEGIFYTPDYITDYICRNTIIPYLSKSGKINTIPDLISEYWGSTIEELDKKVKNIKVVDPACGSGAFLNKAADLLLEIHKQIHEIRYKNKKETLIPYFDNIGQRREILLNNIYGVDLNEESVDITKLSLFLKVCRNGIKLPNLDNNIKCGNSLIDDLKYTDKPFNWEIEFSEILKEGGFDIVIGNPPYVRHQKISVIKPYFKINFKTYSGLADLYVYFFEKGLNILKNGGMFSFISSNKFLTSGYGFKLRKLILDQTFISYHDFTGNKIFESATVHPCIVTLKKTAPDLENRILINNSYEIPQYRLDDGNWSISDVKILDLRDKVYMNCIKLGHITGLNIFKGILTGCNNAFLIDKQKLKELKLSNDFNNIIKPILRGKDVKKYLTNYKELYIILVSDKDLEDLKIIHPQIYYYLKKFENTLKNRSQVKRGDHPWFTVSNNPSSEYLDEFDKNKIIWSEMAPKPYFTLDKNRYILLDTMFLLTLENHDYDIMYLLTLLNSNLLFWIFKQTSPQIEGNRLRFKKQYIENLPIYPAILEEQNLFVEKGNEMLIHTKAFQNEVATFNDWLMHTFIIEKLSQKLEKYYELSFENFLIELQKKKVDVKSRDNYQILKEEFEKSIKIINPLISQINETDKTINQMVYGLYGLSADEIKIIEESLYES